MLHSKKSSRCDCSPTEVFLSEEALAQIAAGVPVPPAAPALNNLPTTVVPYDALRDNQIDKLLPPATVSTDPYLTVVGNNITYTGPGTAVYVITGQITFATSDADSQAKVQLIPSGAGGSPVVQSQGYLPNDNTGISFVTVPISAALYIQSGQSTRAIHKWGQCETQHRCQ